MVDERWTARNLEPKGPLNLIAPSLNDRALSALDQLLDRDWWCRVWIIQEATSPTKTYLVCGRYGTKFTKVIATVNIVSYYKIHQSVQGDFQLERICPDKGLDILSLLDRSRIRQATDLHDKLYALFGLVTDIPDNALKPDYSKPVDEVYI
ncbi:hypothetical protein B0J14DRAFT_652241 [Halenospora varia]|nr:hypothetical protein B0J14DRAFT_652241 [Halenospora varia]